MQHYWFKSSDAAVDRFTFRVRKILVHPRLIPKVPCVYEWDLKDSDNTLLWKMSFSEQIL